MKNGRQAVWDLVFRTKAADVDTRKYFGIVAHGQIIRGSVEEKDGRRCLRYYGHHTDQELASVDLDELQTGSSPNDSALKVFITAAEFALAALAPLWLLWNAAGLLRNGPMHFGLIMVLYLALGMVIFFAWFAVENHFVKMDHGWSTAINNILGQNIPASMDGIKECMVECRRFVKWRRYLTYLASFLIAAWIVEGGAIIAVAMQDHSRIHIIDGAVAASIVAAQAVMFSRLSFLNWYYTRWRDPSLQLCVAFAALDRDLVAQIRGRAR